MTYLGEALPVTGRALQLRTSFNRSLIDSLKYLLEACIEVIPSHCFSKANQTLASLNPELKLSGLLGIIHSDFFNAAEQQDLQRVKQIAERLATDSYQIQETKYVTLSEINNFYSPLVKTMLTTGVTTEVNYFSLSSKEFVGIKNAFQQGIAIYKESFSEFYKEFQELISEILVIKAQGLKGGSSFDAFGMIFLGYLDKWQGRVSEVLDFIVHEQAHLYVHLLADNDRLVLNPSERHEAPLRKEKRPLIGVYHATFVLARVQYVLGKALASNEIPTSEKTYCEELLTYYRERCQVGLNVLKNHARMTPLGEALITSASKLL